MRRYSRVYSVPQWHYRWQWTVYVAARDGAFRVEMKGSAETRAEARRQQAEAKRRSELAAMMMQEVSG